MSRRVLTRSRCEFATQNGWIVWTLDWILFPYLFLYWRQMFHHQHRAYKNLKRVPWENVFAGWLVILPEDWGEFLCHLNLIILKPFITHYFSSVSKMLSLWIGRVQVQHCLLVLLQLLKLRIFQSLLVSVSLCCLCTSSLLQNIIWGATILI